MLMRHLRSYSKGFNVAEGREARDTAKRVLFGLSKIEDILKNGKIVSVDSEGKKGWNHNTKHNAGWEFLSLMGEYDFQGKKRKFVVDVRRRHDGGGSMRAYHINAEGNASFERKRESLSFDARPRFEVCGLRVI